MKTPMDLASNEVSSDSVDQSLQLDLTVIACLLVCLPSCLSKAIKNLLSNAHTTRAEDVRKQKMAEEENARRKKETEEVARKLREAEVESARRQQQQREAEEAARVKKEAEDRARKQKEAEEAVRAQKEADEAARKQRETEEAKRIKKEADDRARALKEAEEAALRDRERSALTPELFNAFETLSKIYPTALKYQKMTVNAKAVLLAGDLDLALTISAQRSALQYNPETDGGVADMLEKLLDMKHRLLNRESLQRNDLTSIVSFENAEICLAYLDKMQKLVGSRVDAGDLKIIPWSELSPTVSGPSLLGMGQFGAAYKLLWSNQPVAVKVVSFEKCEFTGKNYDVELLHSVQEAEQVVDICNRGGIGIDELVVKVYGFVEGPITSALEPSLDLPAGDKAFGIVMRLEAGGTLRERLHASPGMPQMPLSMPEKLRFIQQITRGLFELHKMGVIHADMKPANTLLSDKNPPDCRLADFGQSFVREDTGSPTRLGVSTFQFTSVVRGTPVYSAPEMLRLFDDDDEGDGLAGKASRSTDVYSLGIMIHEILSMQEPFTGLSMEMLTRNVCGGDRPPLDQLPADTPPDVRALMEKCWDGDRDNRASAAECLSVMSYTLSAIESSQFDIFFSYSHAKKAFVVHLYEVLTKLGFRIWLDQNNLGHDMTASMKKGIENSTVTMCFADQNYQQSKNCQAELQHARSGAKKSAVVVFVEGNFWSWSTDAFQKLCDVKTKKFADLSEVACQAWDDPDKVDGLLDALAASTALEDVLWILKGLDCRPSIPLTRATGAAVTPAGAPLTSMLSSLFRGRSKRSKVYIDNVEQQKERTSTVAVVRDPAQALTPAIFRKYNELSKTYPLIQQYEDLTERANKAFTAGQTDELKRLGAAREALQYAPAPQFSIAAGRSQLVQLQIELMGQRKKMFKELDSSQSIESGVACSLYLDKVQDMLNSRLQAADMTMTVRVDAIGKNDVVTALTPPLQDERTYLMNNYIPTLQYETLTQAARQAYDARQWDDLRMVGAQRAALNYTPPSGFTVASSRARLEALRTTVEQRQRSHLDELHRPENIDYVVACTDCLNEVNGLLDLGMMSQAAPPPVSSVSKPFPLYIYAPY